MMRKLSDYSSSKTAAASPTKFGRGLSPAAAFVTMVLLAAMVLLTTILAGERYATYRLTIRERLIGNTLAHAVDHLLDTVQSKRRAELAKLLVGRPCNEIRDSLAAIRTYVRYSRAAALAIDGRVYCSTALGAIDVPLSVYASRADAGTSIRLLHETPFQPRTAVIALFDATGDRRGILYIVEGAYIADALAQAVGLDARAMLSVDGTNAIDDKGTFSDSLPANALSVASHRWPFSIRVLPLSD
jgi:hypothetical protein